MDADYSVETCRSLREAFCAAEVLRPMRIGRYDGGEELTYEITGVAPAGRATVRLAVERFVGGGFAGQVYRVNVVSIDGGEIDGLEVGGRYALKVLVPPLGRAKKFRDAIYTLGFQGAFSLQVNPAAARAGAIWSKLIRRAAKIRLGTEEAVVDVLGTFVDNTLGACGQISEWIEGRNWRFELDDHLGHRARWHKGKDYDPAKLGSPEYCAKRTFMAELVGLLHEMGAPELARQYEWWTAKSQPNVLKRLGSDSDPQAGLTAVDFQAGLALLPMLPMSPMDFKLIARGFARGSLVQFDRGDLTRLGRFIDANAEDFADLREAFEELKSAEQSYRDSLPDITHHHVRLLYSRRLWSNILDGAVTGWQIRGLTDASATRRLRRSRFLTIVFAMLALAPLLAATAGVAVLAWAWATGRLTWGWACLAAVLALAVPLLTRPLRKLAGRADYRWHYAGLLVSWNYLRRAFRAHVAETLIGWHRAGRIGERRAMKLNARPGRFLLHLPLSVLPAKLHRFLTDLAYAAEKLRYIFVRPVRLFFNAEAREQWLRDMVAEGQKKHMLTDEDAERILSRVKEPFIQKYLKALAVHVCTLPITQIVSVAVAIWYKVANNLTWGEAWDEMLLILVAFQVIPISPGSIVRGLYVVYLVIRERNFKDYNIAVFLGFFKYVGYLAFPIQMAYHYPALARFMAAHWATEAVHFLPVFGERGALLEHGVFDLFYNRPLTIRRRMGIRARQRADLAPRAWHAVPIIIVATALFGITDIACRATWGSLPTLGNIWPVTVLLPLIVGAAVTLGAGGMSLARRIRMTVICAVAVAVGYSCFHAALSLVPALGGIAITEAGQVKSLVKTGTWSVFIFTLLATVSALLAEISLPDPKRT